MTSDTDSQNTVPAVEEISLEDHDEAPVAAKSMPNTNVADNTAPTIAKTPSPAATTGSQVPADGGFTPLVSVVGFHHARGPEVESWFGAGEGVDPAAEYGWGLLSFMALSDGAHA